MFFMYNAGITISPISVACFVKTFEQKIGTQKFSIMYIALYNIGHVEHIPLPTSQTLVHRENENSIGLIGGVCMKP
jgi:hypothetical protein